MAGPRCVRSPVGRIDNPPAPWFSKLASAAFAPDAGTVSMPQRRSKTTTTTRARQKRRDERLNAPSAVLPGGAPGEGPLPIGSQAGGPKSQKEFFIMSGFKVAVVGATGNVGREMLAILAERRFPVAEVVALASPASIGREVSFGDRTLKCKALEHLRFLRRRHLPDVGGRRRVEGMVAEDRRRRARRDRQFVAPGGWIPTCR